MQLPMRRTARSLAACTLTALTALGVSATAADAAQDAFQDRADELVATFGSGSSYWTNWPTNPVAGDARTEWKKGVFYSAMAVKRQEEIARTQATPDIPFADSLAGIARDRLDQGLDQAGSLDMFALVGLVDYWQRFPDPAFWAQIRVDPDPGADTSRLKDLQDALWSRACWAQPVTVDPQYTGNKRLMLYTAALFGALDTSVSTRPSGNTCTTATLAEFVNKKTTDPAPTYEGAKEWVERFLDETVKYGFSEADSATYVGNYLQPLRLLADKYPDARIAGKAAKLFDWIVANNAGEWTSEGIAATTGRQYFMHDGHAGRPLTLNGFLRTAFGGQYYPAKQWEASLDTRKPWTAVAVPLALSSWRPDARVVKAATERTEPFAQRETTRMNLVKVPDPTGSAPDPLPPLARSYRAFAPNLASVASTSSDPIGWGSQQAQEFTLRTQAVTTTNRTLSIASPYTQALPTATDSSINASPDLQWLQSGTAAIGASWATTSPRLIRMLIAQALIPNATWANNVNANGWTILRDDTALVGIKFVTAPTANGLLFGDTYGVRSNNPGSLEGNFVIVETARNTGAQSITDFTNTLTARNAFTTCTGINAPPACTKPTPASRTSLEYTTIAGRKLKIAYPDTSGRPQRWIDDVLQSDQAWPMLENPWLQQNTPSRTVAGKAGGDVLRASAITGGSPASTTTVTQYRVWPWTTTTASPTIVAGVDGRFEDPWSTSVPPGFVAANWQGQPGTYSLSATNHTGSTAARVEIQGTNTYGNAGISLAPASRPTPTKQRATFTAWLKTNNVSRAATHGAYISAQWVNSAGTGVCDEQTSEPVNGTTLGTTTAWVSRSVTLQPKSDCAGAVKVAVSLRLRSNTGGSVVFDDLDWADHD